MPYPSPRLFPSPTLFPGEKPVVPPVPERASGPIILCDSDGVEVAELEAPHTIRFEQSAAMSVKFTLGYHLSGASELLSMLDSEIPQLRAYRTKGGSTDRSLIFRGWWMPHTESADGSDTDGIECEFRSPFARLETRFLESKTSFANTDDGQIVWSLIDNTNSDGPTGLVQGVMQTNVKRDRTYEAGTQLSQAVTDLTQVGSGFQFTETPLDGKDLAAFNVWSNLGRDLSRSVFFEYGEGTITNVLSMSRTISPPINRAVAIGGDATHPQIKNAMVSQGKYGVWMAAQDFSSDVNDNATLQELASKMLQPNPVKEVTFEPDIANSPQPIDDYWLGDTIGFRAIEHGLRIEETPRITAIEMDRDANGMEVAHRLEFGPVIVEQLVAERVRGKVRLRSKKRTGGRSALPSKARGTPGGGPRP